MSDTSSRDGESVNDCVGQGSGVPTGGDTSDRLIIGGRKKAMHRACKRIPGDVRVMSWRINQFQLEMMKELNHAMFYGEPTITIYEE